MATVNKHVLLSSHPDKLVLLAEQCSDYGGGPVDVDTVEDVSCRVPLRDMVRQGTTAERAFGDLLARLDDPKLLPVVATGTLRAAARV
jgi:hypothetical protein